jgi:hypothetical protein
MVEDRINEWISINYGEVPHSVKIEIAKTFELYWDEFTFWYAEIKTKQIHKP